MASRVNGVIGSPIGLSALSATSAGVPSSNAFATSPISRSSTRFTTKAAASWTSTVVFFSALPSTNAVERTSSLVFGARTISSSGMTATGLKKWKPTTRSGCSRSAAISVTESEEVLVARMQSSETTASTSAKTCFFTDSSSNTASITKSASAKASLEPSR